MKKSLSLVLFCSILLTLISCKRVVHRGSGESGTESRTTGQFSAVEISAPLVAVIEVDSTATQSTVSFTGYKNLLSLIRTEVSGNKLRIYTDDLVHYNTDKDIIATIRVPSLSLLEITGAGEAEVKGTLRGNDFKLDVTGAGDVTIDDLRTQTFSAELSGAGSLDIRGGTVDKATYTVTGAGEVTSFPLVARHAIAEVTGAGDIELHATEKLDADITGMGDISYKGHPAITQDITGAGDLSDAN